MVAHAEQGFTANIPLAALEDENALIAYEADGEPLTADHGWPVRLSCPRGTSGRAPSGYAGSSSLDQTSPASGSATATTTTPTSGRKSATRSSSRSRRRCSVVAGRRWSFWRSCRHPAASTAAGDLAADLAGRVLRRVDVDVGVPPSSAARTFGVTVTVPVDARDARPAQRHRDRAGDARLPRWMCAASALPVSRENVRRQVSDEPLSVAVNTPVPRAAALGAGARRAACRASPSASPRRRCRRGRSRRRRARPRRRDRR